MLATRNQGDECYGKFAGKALANITVNATVHCLLMLAPQCSTFSYSLSIIIQTIVRWCTIDQEIFAIKIFLPVA